MLFATPDGQNAFFIDFKVRVYRYYEFFDYLDFSDLSQSFKINSINIYYRIFNTGRAFVRFEYGNNDYFLIVECFFDGETTPQTLTILLNEFFVG